jgi:chaperonin GroES
MKKTINWLLEKADVTNLAEELDDKLLEEIGQRVLTGFGDDEDSRSEWLDDVQGWIDMAMQVAEEKSYPWENAANVKYPTLTVAAHQFHARAYPAIVPSRDVVKGKVTGYDPGGEKLKRAERIGKHMTYQVMEEMEEWEVDMDKGLLILPIVGCFFKKSYHDPHKARNVSKAVWAQDLVIDYEAESVERAPRKSEEFTLYPSEVEERMRTNLWRDIKIDYEDEDGDQPESFIEQHTSWDLDGDGYKEPYVITIHKESGDVMRIAARYDEDAIFYMDGERLTSVGQKRREVISQNEQIKQQNMQAARVAQQAQGETGYSVQPPALKPIPEPTFDDYQVAKIEPIEYYTLYPFLPSPDGSIYSMGFGQLLGSLSDAGNTTINQMLDAGSLANLGGGFMSKSAKRPSGPQQAEVGEYIAIETNGMPVRDAVLPFQFRGPSAQSFSLLELLLTAAKDITGIKDISSELGASTKPTTAMIIQEESQRVYSSLYKRIFKSAKGEFKKLYRLNSKYLPAETYFNVLDSPEAIKREDYTADGTDVQPVGDPTAATGTQRILRAEALLPMVGQPGVNSYEIQKRYLEALDTPNIDDVLIPPSKEISPAEKAEIQRIEDEHNEKIAKIGEIQAKIIKLLADAEAVEVGTQLDKYAKQMQILLGEGNGQTEQGGLSSVEAEPGDAMAVQGAGGIPAETA